MKKFIVKLFKVALLFYSVLWLLQLVIDRGLKRSDDDTFYNWNKIHKGEINADIIFLGSSRTLKHYNPKIFDQKLNVNSYNFGSNGSAFDTQEIKLKGYLKHNKKPTVLVLNVDIESLKKSPELPNKEQYLPYFSLDNFRKLNAIDSDVKYEYLMPMSKYRDNLKTIGLSIKGIVGIKENNLKTNKGFSGSSETWNTSFDERLKKLNGKKFNYSNFNLNERFTFFESFVGEIESSNILLLLVWAPEYIGRQELESEILDKCVSEYKRIANKYKKVEFIDFTKDSICFDKYYFYDSYHLNNIGATKFSNMLTDSIKKYFKIRH
jgi:hypothetical protein